ncbi:MAG: hypothetical protein IJQ83_00520 [Bacteroidales bacterium]|nr:hypothetical protein [Bacteroidales bacterium]
MGGKAVGRGARGSGLPSPAAFSSHARSSHVIPTLACGMAWDLWLRRFFMKKKQAFLLAFMKNTIFAEKYFSRLNFLP